MDLSPVSSIDKMSERCRMCGDIIQEQVQVSLLEQQTAEWLTQNLKLQVDITNGFPTQMCESCEESIHEWKYFLQRCETSHQYFTSQIQDNQPNNTTSQVDNLIDTLPASQEIKTENQEINHEQQNITMKSKNQLIKRLEINIERLDLNKLKFKSEMSGGLNETENISNMKTHDSSIIQEEVQPKTGISGTQKRNVSKLVENLTALLQQQNSSTRISKIVQLKTNALPDVDNRIPELKLINREENLNKSMLLENGQMCTSDDNNLQLKLIPTEEEGSCSVNRIETESNLETIENDSEVLVEDSDINVENSDSESTGINNISDSDTQTFPETEEDLEMSLLKDKALKIKSYVSLENIIVTTHGMSDNVQYDNNFSEMEYILSDNEDGKSSDKICSDQDNDDDDDWNVEDDLLSSDDDCSSEYSESESDKNSEIIDLEDTLNVSSKSGQFQAIENSTVLENPAVSNEQTLTSEPTRPKQDTITQKKKRRPRVITSDSEDSSCSRQPATTPKEYKCKVCSKSFPKRNGLGNHMRKHVPQIKKTYSCKKCSKTFSKSWYLKSHMLTHGDATFTCNICDQKFKQVQALGVHKKRLHQKPDQRTHQCSKCYATFRFKMDLTRHLGIHKDNRQKYTCVKCRMKFVSLYNLSVHMDRAHSKLRPYKCLKCSSAFKAVVDLREHMLTVHEICQVTCGVCGGVYRNKIYLQQHIKKSHGEKKVRCLKCEYVCRTYRDLNCHIKNVHKVE